MTEVKGDLSQDQHLASASLMIYSWVCQQRAYYGTTWQLAPLALLTSHGHSS